MVARIVCSMVESKGGVAAGTRGGRRRLLPPIKKFLSPTMSPTKDGKSEPPPWKAGARSFIVASNSDRIAALINGGSNFVLDGGK